MSILVLLLAVAAPPKSTDALRAAALQLSSDRFVEREAAMLELWEAGEDSIPFLQRVLAGNDPEAIARATELLSRIRFGVTPDTPPSELRQVELFRRGNQATRLEVLQQLTKTGQYERVLGLIGATEPAERNALFKNMEAKLTDAVRQLIAKSEWDRAETLLSHMRSTDRGLQHWVAFHAARGSLDKTIDAERKRFEETTPTERPRQAKALALLCRAAEQPEAALRWAEATDDVSLVDGLLIEQGQWKRLSDQGEISPASSSNVAMERLGMLALIHRWAGQLERNKAVVDEAAQRAAATNGSEQFAGIEVLLVNGRLEQGVDLLKRNNPNKAIYFFAGQFQHDEALKVAGAKPTPEGCRERIQQTVKAIRDGGRDRGDLSMAIETAILANTVGWTKVTDEGFESLAAVCTDASLRYTLISGMMRAGRKQMAFKYGNSTRYRSVLFRNHSSESSLWSMLLKQTDRSMSQTQQWEKIDQLLTGSGPEPDWSELESVAALRARTQGKYWLLMAEAAKARDDRDRAKRYCQKAIEQEQQLAAHRLLGDLYRQEDNWAKAAQAYLDGAPDRTDPVNVYLAGDCLRRAGEQERGDSLCQLALALNLGDDRQSFSSELLDRGLEDGARAGWEFDLRVLELRGSPRATSALLLGDHVDGKEPALAIQMWRQQLISIMRGTTTFTNTISYARLPCMLLRQQAHLDVASGKWQSVRETLEACVRLMPRRISIAEEVAPELDAAGQTELAQWIYEQYRDSMEAAVQSYPESALFLNNTAWLSATCNRDLERAQELSEKAVRIEPDSATYLDTLAEIHFRRGRKQKALELMRRCIELDPEELHFQRQLKRFLAAGAP